MDKVIMHKEIFEALNFLGIARVNYPSLKAHFGTAEKLHKALGKAVSGKPNRFIKSFIPYPSY